MKQVWMGVVGLMLCAGIMPAVSAGVLDGKTFVGQIGEQGKAKGDADQFEFANDQFHSTACDPYGFTQAPYTASVNGDQVIFESETVSATDGRMVWKGNMHGDVIEGTATWYKAAGNNAPESYWFKGTLSDRQS